MAQVRPGQSRGAPPSTRALALAAFMVALGLLAWRASDILTRAPAGPGPLSQSEASLLSVAEAVAGQGHVRVSVARQPGAGRQILVLLDEQSAVLDATLMQVVSLAAGYDAARGDRIELQRAAFAPGVTGAPQPGDWAELCLIALLAGLAGWIGLTSMRRSSAPVEIVQEALPPRTLAPPREPARQVAPAHNAEAADLARRDPARAADVLRRWMGMSGDAA